MFSPYRGNSGLNTGVRPMVVTGNRLTGQGADSTLQGFNKYNNHDHWQANPADFRFYDIAIGDEVYLYDADGNNVIGDALPATVDYISGEELRVTVSSSADITNGILLLKYDKTVYIQGVNADLGSNIIYFYTAEAFSSPGLPGFITPQLASASLSWIAQGSVVNPTEGIYRLLAQLPEPSWFISAAVQTEGEVNPHCDVQFLINTSGSDQDYGQPVTAARRPSETVFVPRSSPTLNQTAYPATYGPRSLSADASISMRIFNVNPAISQLYASNTLTYTLKFHKLMPNF